MADRDTRARGGVDSRSGISGIRRAGQRRQQRRGIQSDQIADPLDRDVRRRIQARVDRVEGVVALTREHRRQTVPENRFHGGQQARFVVDHEIVARRMVALNRIEPLLFVQ